jgi:DNA-binding response OmpR family regulator
VRVLLAEDDRGVSRFIKKGLKEKGYVVDVAFDSEREDCGGDALYPEVRKGDRG